MCVLDQSENFLGLESSYASFENAAFIIIPTPLEQSTSYGKGTVSGPAKILEASHQVELFDEELLEEPFRRGISTMLALQIGGLPIKEAIERIAEQVHKVADIGKFPIILGGEHTVSIGGVQGLVKKGKPFSILQMDAHSDLRDQYEGNPYSHASVMRRIWDLQKSIVLCGIRSQCSEENEFIKSNDIPVFYAHDLYMMNYWERIIDCLLPDVYVTIDCDFFDPSLMPAVGTPEPGGFFWRETIQFLSLLTRKRNLIGFDIVELAPQPSLFHVDFIAARLIYKFIGYIGRAKKDNYPFL